MKTPDPFEDKLKQFADDEVMFYAIRSVFERKCDLNKVAPIDAQKIDNVRLGEIYRAWEQAREIITTVFNEIANYKSRPGTTVQQSQNPNNV